MNELFLALFYTSIDTLRVVYIILIWSILSFFIGSSYSTLTMELKPSNDCIKYPVQDVIFSRGIISLNVQYILRWLEPKMQSTAWNMTQLEIPIDTNR